MFGSLVHQTIEDIHKAYLRGEQISQERINGWFALNYTSLSHSMKAYLDETRQDAALQEQIKYKLDIEVLDILRDKSDLEFKRDSEAEIVKEDGKLVIKQFYPMNLLQKLSLQKETVGDWREMVESVMIDFNYDGAVFEPSEVDVPEKNELVAGVYEIPADAGTIRVKITDLLSESLEMEVK